MGDAHAFSTTQLVGRGSNTKALLVAGCQLPLPALKLKLTQQTASKSATPLTSGTLAFVSMYTLPLLHCVGGVAV